MIMLIPTLASVLHNKKNLHNCLPTYPSLVMKISFCAATCVGFQEEKAIKQ